MASSRILHRVAGAGLPVAFLMLWVNSNPPGAMRISSMRKSAAGIVVVLGTTALLGSVPFPVFAIRKTRESHLKIVIGVVTVLMGGLTRYKALH
jgi:hypothetical protein